MSRQHAISVSEALLAAKCSLETLTFRVVGEISEFSDRPGYKAAYFSVRDESASMSCLMWRDAYMASGIELRCGMLVILDGSFSAYIPKGRLQFIVRAITPAGEGALRLRVAALARKLELEGLMSPERKRPLPSYPERIAVVTSPRGKAVHDVIRTLKRRYPLAHLLIAGVCVEGPEAPGAISEGLLVAQNANADVILLVRGGGSYEDLLSFSDEVVVRAVAQSRVPVVTGIGHEPDTSIADMVADRRASTPTAAAEMVSPSLEELHRMLRESRNKLARALLHRAQEYQHRYNLMASCRVFKDPTVIFESGWQTLDNANLRLQRVLPDRIAGDSANLFQAGQRLLKAGPAVSFFSESRVATLAGRLEDLSPLAILRRGYAVCFAEESGRVVRSVSDVASGQSVSVQVSDGSLRCLIQQVEGG